MLINLIVLTDWATMTCRITKALVRGDLQGVINANPQVLTPNVERGALKYPSPDLPIKLKIR